jgi:hypothetical protein
MHFFHTTLGRRKNVRRCDRSYMGILLIPPPKNSHTLLPRPFFLSYSLFWKIKVCLPNQRAVCVSVYPPFNFWMAEPPFMKLAMYNMTYEPISTTYYINPSHQYVCWYKYVYPSIVVTQRLGKHVPAATNIHATIKESLDASFSMRSVSYGKKEGY